MRIYNSSHNQQGSDYTQNLGSSWATYVVPTAVPTGGYIRIYCNNFYNFYVDDIVAGGGPVPVELTSFRSYLKDDQVELQWTTATELNNFGFEIERSTNGDDWSMLGFVEGHGTSFVPRQYSFRDETLDRSSLELYYRLKQVDRDGTTEYSNVLRVALTAPSSVNLTAYPQPFAGNLNLDITSGTSEQITITLYNSAMQKVATLYEGVADGSMTMTIPTMDLRDGSYFLIVNHANGETQVQKLLHLQSR
ncbi:MAG: T9SS type A sorting domain-containing protein [Bacteroidetes bacterium]|nr:T9SS type A sorting domain-containing protein [Bacteroidota bacterium]